MDRLEERQIHTIGELRRVLEGVTLAPSAPLNLREWSVEEGGLLDGPLGWFIAARHKRPDRDTGLPAVGCARRWFVEQGCTEGAVVKTALVALLMLVEHEVREAFLYLGHRPFDPHKSLDGLLQAQ